MLKPLTNGSAGDIIERLSGYLSFLHAFPDSRINGIVYQRSTEGGDTAWYNVIDGKVSLTQNLLDALNSLVDEKKIEGCLRVILRHEAWHSSYTRLRPKVVTMSQVYLINHLEDWRNHNYLLNYWPSESEHMVNLYAVLSKNRKAEDGKEQAKFKEALEKMPPEKALKLEVYEQIRTAWMEISHRTPYPNFSYQLEEIISRTHWRPETRDVLRQCKPHMIAYRDCQPEPFNPQDIEYQHGKALAEADKIFKILDPFFTFEQEKPLALTPSELKKAIEEELKRRGEPEEPKPEETKPEETKPEEAKEGPEKGQEEPSKEQAPKAGEVPEPEAKPEESQQDKTQDKPESAETDQAKDSQPEAKAEGESEAEPEESPDGTPQEGAPQEGEGKPGEAPQSQPGEGDAKGDGEGQGTQSGDKPGEATAGPGKDSKPSAPTEEQAGAKGNAADKPSDQAGTEPGQGTPDKAGQPKPAPSDKPLEEAAAKALETASTEDLKKLKKTLEEIEKMPNQGALGDKVLSPKEGAAMQEAIGNEKRKGDKGPPGGAGYSDGSRIKQDPIEPVVRKVYDEFTLKNNKLINHVRRLFANAKQRSREERGHQSTPGKLGQRVRIRGVVSHMSSPSDASKIFWQREGGLSKGKSKLALENLLIGIDCSGSMRRCLELVRFLLAVICEACRDSKIPTSVVAAIDGAPDTLATGGYGDVRENVVHKVLNLVTNGGTDMGNGSLDILRALKRPSAKQAFSRLMIVTDCMTSLDDLQEVAAGVREIKYPTCILAIGTHSHNVAVVHQYIPEASIIVFDEHATAVNIYRYFVSVADWMSDPVDYHTQPVRYLSEFGPGIRPPSHNLLPVVGEVADS